MSKESEAYKSLCTEFYDLDKPTPPKDAFECYLRFVKEAKGPILEPMCGTGRFLIPLVEKGFQVTGFDSSPYMLNLCRKKCKERGLSTDLFEASFETFKAPSRYNLIFIPSGSFGHLITSDQVSQALAFIAESLTTEGKFVFEVETLKAIREPQGVWRGRSVNRSDGSKIVLNVLTEYNSLSRIETGLFRYELWQENAIVQTEVEVFHVRHYEPAEIEKWLQLHGLQVVEKLQAEPHSGLIANDQDAVILYECSKGFSRSS